MDTLERLSGRQELVALHVPGVVAGPGLDLHRIRSGDESLLILFEVALVGEGQRGLGLREDLPRVLGRCFPLWVEVPHGLAHRRHLDGRDYRLRRRLLGLGYAGAI